MAQSVEELSDAYVEQVAALDPVTATSEGIAGHDAELTDYSPDGIARRREHAAAVRLELERLVAAAPPDAPSDRERVAVEVLRRHVEVELDLLDAGEELRALRVISSPVSNVRMCFDLMARDTADDWETIVARTEAVPAALAGFADSLREGLRLGLTAAPRQVEACARQAATWGGAGAGSGPPTGVPFFLGLVEEYSASGLADTGLRARFESAARRGTEAYATLGRFLVDDYLPGADAPDAVGAERYGRWAQAFNGTALDLEETYAWGWDELHRIEDAMADVAARILPGASVPEVIEHLETESTDVIDGEDALRAWLQALMDRTVAELDGTHFDIPAPVRRVEAMIAPPGGAAAMYYTGPSEDFSRPGRTWYPTQGNDRFPLWGEVSTCYHEGVPGHHLQIGMTRYLADRLTRFQRTLAGTSGHAEGWALYAERLMGELGYLENPAYELGMLRAQAMRAARVVVDIGLHLELPISSDDQYHPGERWTPELALPFVCERTYFPAHFMISEVDRYLGWPGQAISYKVGERVWLECRADARRRAGATFDLKDFHTRALALGPMGLDQLRAELGRL